jgi:hypothetical protein
MMTCFFVSILSVDTITLETNQFQVVPEAVAEGADDSTAHEPETNVETTCDGMYSDWKWLTVPSS